MEKDVTVWFDREADYLEVLFETKEGYFEETEDDAVMRKVDRNGNVLGFSILKVSALKAGSPLSVSLSRRTAKPALAPAGRLRRPQVKRKADMIAVEAMTMKLEERAGEPAAWLEQAQSLYLAAEVLGSALAAEVADPTPSPNRRVRVLGLVRGYMTLLASAFENSLKAIAIARDRVKTTGGKIAFEGVGGSTNHNLLEMAQSLRVQLSDEERGLFARSSAYLRWAGRYPVALRISASAADANKQLLSMKESDLRLAQALAERLCSLAR